MICAGCHRWKIQSDLQNVDFVCQEARDLIEEAGLKNVVFITDLMLREFVNNAIIHGNRRNTEKCVQIFLKVKKYWLVIKVKDEGKGFNWREAIKKTPSVDDISGRGLFIARQYGVRITYNSVGNKVIVRIKLTGGNTT